ncbi:MAG: trigger factor [bacterium]|nr:trigger factor [bacterium]
MPEKRYSDLSVKKLEHSECEIAATIPTEIFASYRTRALKKLGSDIEIPGFRKGHAPEDVIAKHIGEDAILKRAADMALADVYPAIITAEKIDAIGSPHIHVTKLASGNPLEFTAKTAVMPEVNLPDYARIAKAEFSKAPDLEVKDSEVEDVLTHIRRQRAQIESFEKQKAEGIEKPELPEVQGENLPELTDEFVQTLGDFKTVAEFKAKVRENVQEEKRLRDIEKKRVATAEEIIKQTSIDLPAVFVEQEKRRIQSQMEGQAAQAGIKFEDYLRQAGKTIEELRNEWKPEAEKRAKLQLILNKIADEQKIEPQKDEVEREIEHVLEHYPQADRENVRIYVETTKRNEQVFQHLQKLGTEK